MRKIQFFVLFLVSCALFLSAQSKIYWVDGGTGKVQRANTDGSSVQDLATSQGDTYAIDVDNINGKMYWGKGTSPGFLKRANLDGTGVEVLWSAAGNVCDIALDAVHGKVYWTDNTIGTIRRADLNGSNVQDLLTGRSNPNGISVDAANGKMYWVERTGPIIYRANLDGSSVEGLITSGLSSPYGLELDLKNSKIYFSDFGTGKIQRANLDGTGVTDILTGLGWDVDAIALDVDNSIIYYATYNTTISKVNFNGTGNAVVVSGLTLTTGVDFYSPTYTISGSAGVAGATLSYTDGSAKTATADGSGNYSFSVSNNWSGIVTPLKLGYTFVPASRTYANVLADQTSQNYAAAAITYTISGNAGIAGATLSYTDGSAKTATADGSGNYSFAVSYNWSGTVTPSLTGYAFTPTGRTYTNVLADQMAQNYTAAAITYIISGNAGIAGATLSYTDGSAKTATADGSGNYSFAVSYNWSGTVTPSLSGYAFTPTSRTYANVLADQTAQNYAATAITYIITGNAGIAGVTLSYTDGSAKTATADGSGNYSFAVSYNWSGTVTPSLSGYAFTPTSRTYANVLADQTSQNYAAAAITYIISGNAGIAGVTLSYTDGSAKTANADGSGNYSFAVLYNWSGTVAPSLAGYAFTPTSRAYTNVLADQTVQNYTAAAITYTISGNAGIAGATLSYIDGSAKTATADGSGNYSFAVSYNWSGTVTPSLAGYAFTPTSRAYTNVLADQTVQNYTAAAITYTISGNAGIAGATLSYTDGSAKTATADGSGNYSFAVSYNWSGTVTPSLAGYVFTPTSRTYSNVLADQTAQNYAAAAVTYTISGNAGIAGVTLSYTDGSAKTATTDGSGNYSFVVSYNWSGTVTPSLAGYAFTPTSRTYSNVLADQTSQNYTAAAITYIISGNAGIAGVTLSYTDGSAKTATTDGSGNYSFVVSYNWSGTVTPSLAGYAFTPTSRTYANVLADQTSQNYTAIQVTYIIDFITDGTTGATLTGLTSQTVNHGASCSAVMAKAPPDYRFVNWTGTGGFGTTAANPLTVTNVTAAMTITANFSYFSKNESPIITITNPKNGDIVSGIVAIKAEAVDDKQIAEVAFYIDDQVLRDNDDVQKASNKKNRVLDLGDLRFNVDEGIALALDRNRQLMLLTHQLQWRQLAGAEANILDLQADYDGFLYLRRRKDNGDEQWLKIDSLSLQAEIMPMANARSRQLTGNQTPILPWVLPLTKSGGTIIIHDEIPLHIEWHNSEANSRSWLLPLVSAEKMRRAGIWLAIEGATASGKAICLLNCSAGYVQTFEFGKTIPSVWTILSNGSLLVGNQIQAESPGDWGIFHNSAHGWFFQQGEELNCDLACLVPLATESLIDANGKRDLPFNLLGETGNYSINWDTKTLSIGRHFIKAIVMDDEGLTGQDQIEVFVQNIVLGLSLQRHKESLWIIHHDYADITITLDNPNQTPVAKFILERCESGSWATLAEIAPGDFTGGEYQFQDDYLESNMSYTYRVRALDGSGAIIASSVEVII